jgi:hypothetical protein
MNTWLRRFLGFLMVLAAVAGIAFTTYIGMQVWRIKPRVVESLNTNITLIQDIVTTSSDLLVLVDDTC